MAERSQHKTESSDSLKLIQKWAELNQRCLKVFAQVVHSQTEGDQFKIPDPTLVTKAFINWTFKAMEQPEALLQAQLDIAQRFTTLWQAAATGRLGPEGKPVVEPERGDRRFRDERWDKDVGFNFLKQAYLITAGWLQSTVRRIEGLDEDTSRKVDFYTRLWVDALAPSNFVVTNPRVLQRTLESGGENLVQGFENLLDDIERGRGRLDISMTDYQAFRLGENVATTPGKVIYQNELMQLLQYAPSTEQVFRRPLLIVPPWINKFYILDLQPKNSFIKWAVDRGHSVFVISWINPDERLTHKSFEDYMVEGPRAALDAIALATDEQEVNVIGYCIGGTLTATTLAYMAAQDDSRIKSTTFFTSLLDFSEPGEIGVFIDDEQLAELESHMNKKGYLEGHHMATVFNLMRDNDLIWSFAINNYLLGKDPFPFDLLYWNSDCTRMPAMMHNFYLRKMYKENLLVKPNAMAIRGVPIDLRQIQVPAYFLSTREDHIAPWKSTYAATQIFTGPIKFVLSASGHIAGVINPPVAKKYCYWTNPKNPNSPGAWLRNARRHEGSWWTDWAAWVARRGGGKVRARTPGEGKLTPIEEAPGSYVKVRLSD